MLSLEDYAVIKTLNRRVICTAVEKLDKFTGSIRETLRWQAAPSRTLRA